MAGGSDYVVIYHRNHNASDTTQEPVLNDLVARSVDRLGFSAPEGMEFSAWNTAQDASGISYAVGDTVTLSQNSGAELYAVWVVPVIPYIVTSEELTDVADAIRTKGGTSAALEWPDGYVSAIEDIETGGGVETAHISADLTIGGSAYYTNANGEVCTEQYDNDTGMVGINDDAIVGSLVVFYALMMPIAPPTGATFVKQISSQKGNRIEVYEVTG